jgi:hypothetical protein
MTYKRQIAREFAKVAFSELSREVQSEPQSVKQSNWPFALDSFETSTFRHLVRWLANGNTDAGPFTRKEMKFLRQFCSESDLRPGSFIYRTVEDQWPREATNFPLPVGSLGFTSWTTDPIVSKNKMTQGDKTMLRAQLPESNWLDTLFIIQKLKKILPTLESWAEVFHRDFPHPEEKEVMVFQPIRADVTSPLKN